VTEIRHISSISIAVVVTILIAVTGFSCLTGRGTSSSARMIAFPADIQESSVLAALALVDIDDVVGSSSALVPLSNFSRIIAVTFQNARQRVLPGDPRSTPFLDELKLRFSVPGPDDAPWTVIYIPGPSRSRDEATARVLTSLSPEWAWDDTGSTAGSRWFMLPSLLWALWLVARNPRRDRFQRVLWVISFSPMLLGANTGGLLLYIVLTAASTVASRYMLSGSALRLPSMLWPYIIVTIALLMYEPESLWRIAVSIVLSVSATYLKPRLERFASRKRLHVTPAFRTITMSGVHDYARRIIRVQAVPVVVIIIMTIVVPARVGSELEDAPPFRIKRNVVRVHHDVDTLFEEHLAFQRAITYGRLGDFSLENTSYAPAYRYKEEDGRMVRTDDSGESPGDWPPATFKVAIRVLSDDAPGSILPK